MTRDAGVTSSWERRLTPAARLLAAGGVGYRAIPFKESQNYLQFWDSFLLSDVSEIDFLSQLKSAKSNRPLIRHLEDIT